MSARLAAITAAIFLLFGDGNGGFVDVTTTHFPPSFGGDTVEVGDLDGDGDLDAVFSRPAAFDMMIANDGTGRFTEENSSFLDPAFADREVVGPFVEGLEERAGPLVFQFPPLGREIVAEPQRFSDRLHDFLAGLPAGPDYAVEIRDRKLFGEPYLDAVEAAGAAASRGWRWCTRPGRTRPWLQRWRRSRRSRPTASSASSMQA